MSARRRIILAPAARQDLRSIQLFTEQRWGRHQRIAYRAKLQAAIQRLSEFPALGIGVVHMSAGLHSLPVEQHVIYYKFDDESVTIRRILHGHMDATIHLGL